MSEGSEETWKVAGSKRQRGMRSPIQDTPRKKIKTNKKVEKEETAEFRATTLVMNTAEWSERSSRYNRFVNRSSDAEDCHQTRNNQNRSSCQGPSNRKHSVADDEATEQSNQLQATITKNHGYRHCPKSTGCSTYGPFRGHPGNPVGRKNDNVGPQGKGRGTYDECEDSMGRHTPHINPDRLPRNISSETVHTRSDTVLPLPKVRPHKQNVLSDQLNMQHLRRQTQHSRMHRKTEDNDNQSKMQQLHRTAHNSIKSMSCTETKGTSYPEVCPDKASQVRTEDNTSTDRTANIRPNNVGLFSCTGSPKEQNTTIRHDAQTHTRTNKENHIHRYDQRQACTNQNSRASNQQGTSQHKGIRQHKRSSQHKESSQHKGISQHKGASQQTAINQQSPDDQLDKDTTRHEQSRSTRCVRANFGHARNTTAATTTSYGSTRPGCKDDRQINDNISSNTNDTISEAGLAQVHHEAAVRNKDSGDVHLSAGRTQALDGTEKIRELKIVHWNAQGANQKTARITSTILNENIDIMMIQDTRLQ